MTNSIPPMIRSEYSISIFLDGQQYTAIKGQSHFDKICKLVDEKKYSEALEAFKKEECVKRYCAPHPDIKIENGVISYRGEEVHNTVCDRIISFVDKGLEIKPLVNFLVNLMQNVSGNSIDQAYKFLETERLAITEDGMVLAFKAVRNNWMDKYSNTIRNMPGDKPEMPRNQVTDNPALGCHKGLHAGNLRFVNGFKSGDDRVIVVKINPKDFVSIPNEDCGKARVCRYEVLSEYTGPLTEDLYAADGSKYEQDDGFCGDDPREDDDDDSYDRTDYEMGYDRGIDDANVGTPMAYDTDGCEYSKGYIAGYADAIAD